jgi:hypothetical protein
MKTTQKRKTLRRRRSKSMRRKRILGGCGCNKTVGGRRKRRFNGGEGSFFPINSEIGTTHDPSDPSAQISTRFQDGGRRRIKGGNGLTSFMERGVEISANPLGSIYTSQNPPLA